MAHVLSTTPFSYSIRIWCMKQMFWTILCLLEAKTSIEIKISMCYLKEVEHQKQKRVLVFCLWVFVLLFLSLAEPLRVRRFAVSKLPSLYSLAVSIHPVNAEAGNILDLKRIMLSALFVMPAIVGGTNQSWCMRFAQYCLTPLFSNLIILGTFSFH